MRLQEIVGLAKRIQQQLGDRFVVLARPEHPYLLAPPDLLIGGEGLLTAVFSPKVAEARSPRLLRARLIAGRLALAEHARCILLLTREFDVSELVSPRDFEIVLPANDSHP
jgi:hypothetical protein